MTNETFYMCGLILHTHTHKQHPPSRHRMNYEGDKLEHCHLLERQKDDENKSTIPQGISEDGNPLILASSATIAVKH